LLEGARARLLELLRDAAEHDRVHVLALRDLRRGQGMSKLFVKKNSINQSAHA
jgi:hypothetical protein